MYFGILSIFLISLGAWLFRKLVKVEICLICAGVSGTWLWMLIGVFSGQLPITDYQLPMAILMGGSVVGIAYQVEKRLVLAKASVNKLLLWKLLFIPAGFAAVYGLIAVSWLLFAAALAVSGAIAAFFLLFSVSEKDKQKSNKVGEIEEKMKNCC